jgi:hypothetical protein
MPCFGTVMHTDRVAEPIDGALMDFQGALESLDASRSVKDVRANLSELRMPTVFRTAFRRVRRV